MALSRIYLEPYIDTPLKVVDNLVDMSQIKAVLRGIIEDCINRYHCIIQLPYTFIISVLLWQHSVHNSPSVKQTNGFISQVGGCPECNEARE